MAAGDNRASSGNKSSETPDKSESAVTKAPALPSADPSSDASEETAAGSAFGEVSEDGDPNRVQHVYRPSTTLGIVLLVLLLGVLANGTVAYILWQTNDEQTQAIGELEGDRQEIAVLEGRLDETATTARELQSQLSREVQSSRQQLSALQSRQNTIGQTLTLLEQSDQKLREKVEGGAQAWRLDAVEQLLMLANERLLLARDARGAEQALKLADQRLHALADPAWVEVRQALAGEMAALRAIPAVDATAISLKLRALADRVPGLPLAGHTRSMDGEQVLAAGGDSDASAATAPWYLLAWTKVRDAVLSLVTIRRNTTPTSPLLPPDLHGLLVQNLRLQLESARTALLLRDAGLYRAALGSAADWAQEYLAIDDASVRAALQTLDELRGQDIDPPVPDITGSLRMLRQNRVAD